MLCRADAAGDRAIDRGKTTEQDVSGWWVKSQDSPQPMSTVQVAAMRGHDY